MILKLLAIFIVPLIEIGLILFITSLEKRRNATLRVQQKYKINNRSETNDNRHRSLFYVRALI
ncbi:hypothetical protein LX97_00806 [Nonlabens dokdonensis]|jgi:hypothetical protein|uniref:Uncharacterized protein n=2 Tax=Nonlabens dokdonensis TaxID=328515 RepID=L7W3K0_NONDD|nr:hypothetical protein DDD_1003 [Nonlabens dokdonensis DSW-6]PZX43801.1 hypothetical protein LX97_00806 [Nonlabens dokdonensis]